MAHQMEEFVRATFDRKQKVAKMTQDVGSRDAEISLLKSLPQTPVAQLDLLYVAQQLYVS